MRMLPITLLFAGAALSGCAVTIPQIEVTRFHLGQAIVPGSVKIEGDSSLTSVAFVAAVSQAMVQRGFTDAATSKMQPLYVAKIAPERLTREEVVRSPISIGIGGGTMGGHVGVGVGTNIGLGGGARQIIVTRLSVRLVRASDQQAVWEGRAETRSLAKAPAAQPGLAAEKLANALFKDFPGESGKTITVP